METTLTNVLAYIAFEANDEQLTRIKKEINDRREEKIFELSNTLRVGTIVSFKSRKRGRLIEGKITKVNKKTVKLNCGTAGDWTVDLSLLEIKK